MICCGYYIWLYMLHVVIHYMWFRRQVSSCLCAGAVPYTSSVEEIQEIIITKIENRKWNEEHRAKQYEQPTIKELRTEAR